MSTQQHDQFYYKGIWFDLTATNGKLADIYGILGYEPLRKHTGCHRGYTAVYEILDNSLALGYLETSNVVGRKGISPETELTVFEPTPINGVKPILTFDELIFERNPNSLYRDVKYPDTALKLSFTGAVVIGDNQVWRTWGDFQHPWHYETVFELHFDNGAFIREIDLSNLSLHIRENDKEEMLIESKRKKDSQFAEIFLKKMSERYYSWFKSMYR